MSQSYSLDLRRRIIGLIEEGHSCRAAARHFRVSPKFAVNLKRRWDRRGTVAPDRRGRPARGSKFAPHRAFLLERVSAEPDISMPQLARELARERGVTAAPAELSRFLCRAGYSYKKRR